MNIFMLIISLCQGKKYTQPPIFDFTDGITYDKTRVDRAWKFHLRPISGPEGIQK